MWALQKLQLVSEPETPHHPVSKRTRENFERNLAEAALPREVGEEVGARNAVGRLGRVLGHARDRACDERTKSRPFWSRFKRPRYTSVKKRYCQVGHRALPREVKHMRGSNKDTCVGFGESG